MPQHATAPFSRSKQACVRPTEICFALPTDILTNVELGEDRPCKSGATPAPSTSPEGLSMSIVPSPTGDLLDALFALALHAREPSHALAHAFAAMVRVGYEVDFA